jgi:hypothetical protein
MNMELARLIRDEFPDRSLSGIGGIETGSDATQFILLGADTVQVCTGVMKHGYGMIRRMRDELSSFMDRHDFTSIDDFRGHSLRYFTTHGDLVRRQTAGRQARQAAVIHDGDWAAEHVVQQCERLSGN